MGAERVGDRVEGEEGWEQIEGEVGDRRSGSREMGEWEQREG